MTSGFLGSCKLNISYGGKFLQGNFKGYKSNSVDRNSSKIAVESISSLYKPKVLWPSPREFSPDIDWLFRSFYSGISKVFFDFYTLSWGSYLSEKSKLREAHFIYATEFGAKVKDLPRLFDRLLYSNKGILPDKVYILLAGNDLCAQHPNLLTTEKDYEYWLQQSLQYLLRNSSTPRERY